MTKPHIGRVTSITTIVSCVALHSAYAQPSKLRDHVIAAPPAASRTDLAHKPPMQAPTPPATAISSSNALGVIAAAHAYRQDQIAILIDLIAQTPTNSPDRPEFMYRLAEMYAQAQRLHRLQRVQAEIALASASSSAVRQQLTSTINTEGQREKRDLIAAIRVYNELVTDPAFAKYTKIDQAVFYYGYTLQSGGYIEEAIQQYDALRKNYPASKHVTDALLAIADHHFDGNRLAAAEPLYRQLLKFPSVRGYPYAMYKLAWVLLNRQQPVEALDLFARVVQATQPKTFAVLHRAALQDYVRAYAEVGKVAVAQAAFERLAPGQGLAMLNQVADLYMTQGQFEKAIYGYRELLRNVGNAGNNACEWQANVVRATFAIGKLDDKAAEVRNLVQLRQALAAKGQLQRAALTDCTQTASSITSDTARQFHSEWAKTQAVALRDHSAALYRLHVDAFGNTAEAGDNSFYYAELRWAEAQSQSNLKLRNQSWETAAQAYGTCAQHPSATPALQQRCALIAAEAWQNVLATAAPVTPPVANPATGARPALSSRNTQMLAAFDRFLALAATTPPADPASIADIKFAKAETLRRAGHSDAAVVIFRDILTHHRLHATAEFAANLALDIYNQQGRETELVELNQQLLNDAAFLRDKQSLATRLRENQIIAERRIAEALEKRAQQTGDLATFVACGEAYLRIYNGGPEAPRANEVLYNAGVCFEQGRSLGASITAFQLLRKYYPTDERSAQALARLGNMYADFAFYQQAATALEEYANKYPNAAAAKAALSDAVQFRKGLGDDKKAIADTATYVAKYQSSKSGVADAAAAQWSLTAVLDKQNDRPAMIRHLRDYITRFGRTGAVEHLIAAQTKLGQELWTQACPVPSLDGQCIRVQRERALGANLTRQRQRRGSALPTQCGLASKATVTVIARDPRDVMAAQTAFRQAVTLANGATSKLSGNALAAATYALAVAQFHLAEVDFENYIAIGFPTGLDFDPRKPAVAAASNKRFTRWLDDKQRAGATAREKYQAVFATKEASNAIAAASRIGQIMQSLSDQLYSAEIPANVRTGEFAEDKIASYCDALTTIAEPIEAQAIASYGACLRRSTELGWFSSWSSLCERELGQLRPSEFPSAFELRSAPSRAAPVTTTEGAMALSQR